MIIEVCVCCCVYVSPCFAVLFFFFSPFFFDCFLRLRLPRIQEESNDGAPGGVDINRSLTGSLTDSEGTTKMTKNDFITLFYYSKKKKMTRQKCSCFYFLF